MDKTELLICCSPKVAATKLLSYLKKEQTIFSTSFGCALRVTDNNEHLGTTRCLTASPTKIVDYQIITM